MLFWPLVTSSVHTAVEAKAISFCDSPKARRSCGLFYLTVILFFFMSSQCGYYNSRAMTMQPYPKASVIKQGDFAAVQRIAPWFF